MLKSICTSTSSMICCLDFFLLYGSFTIILFHSFATATCATHQAFAVNNHQLLMYMTTTTHDISCRRTYAYKPTCLVIANLEAKKTMTRLPEKKLRIILSERSSTTVPTLETTSSFACSQASQQYPSSPLFFSIKSSQTVTNRRCALWWLIVTTVTQPTFKSCSAMTLLSSDVVDDRKSLTNRPYTPIIDPLLPPTYIFRRLTVALQYCTALNKNNNNKELRSLMYNIFQEPDTNSQSQSRPLFVPSSTMKRRYYQERDYIESQFANNDYNNNNKNILIPLPKLSGQFARASCNVFTANLRFSESYLLTAEPSIKKQMIRNDALPDIKTVITSDLDLRDLYRNSVQTNIEDIQAELFTSKQQPDFIEIQSLLENTISSMNQWLDLVRVQDRIKAEQIIDSWLENKFPIASPTDATITETLYPTLQLHLPDPYRQRWY